MNKLQNNVKPSVWQKKNYYSVSVKQNKQQVKRELGIGLQHHHLVRNLVLNKKYHGDAVAHRHRIVEIVQIVNGQRAEKIPGERILKIRIKHHLEDLRVS